MTSVRLKQLQANCGRARELIGTGEVLGQMTAGRMDTSDLFRSAWVQAVAALDTYVHGVVMDRAVDIILGRKSGGTPDIKVGLHWNAVRAIVGAQSPADLEQAVRREVAARLGRETFQQPDDIAKGLAVVGVGSVWSRGFTDA